MMRELRLRIVLMRVEKRKRDESDGSSEDQDA